MNDVIRPASKTQGVHDYRWVLRYSTIAFLVLTAQQLYGVSRLVPKIEQILQGFGADLPAATVWAIDNYLFCCALIAALALCSTAFVFAKQGTPSIGLKFSYLASIVSVLVSFAWSGWVVAAMYEPIVRLAAPI